MNTVKHAPAPWIAERGGTISAAGKVIANVQMGFQNHNARLIAAAPELLAAVCVVAACRPDTDGGTTLGSYEMGVVRAALAKAGTS